MLILSGYMLNIYLILPQYQPSKLLREYFSVWGIPRKLVTDNGPSLYSYEMEEFLRNNGVIHIKTPPYNPSTNKAAENAVKTFKMFLKSVLKILI